MARFSRGFSFLAISLAASFACAGDEHEHDHDRARAAVRAGEVMPLEKLLERVKKDYPGEPLEVELERKDGRWMYEVKLLRADGRLQKLKVDARSAEVLQKKSKP